MTSWVYSRHLCRHHKLFYHALMARCYAKCHQQWLVQRIRKSSKWWQAVITALAANGSYAFPFSCWQASISSHTGNHHPYIQDIFSRMNETKSPGISIVCSLPLCDEVAVHWCLLMFHGTAITKIFVNWLLQKFNTMKIWCHSVQHLLLCSHMSKISYHCHLDIRALVAQWLEHWSCKPGVRSSNLLWGFFVLYFVFFV